MDEKYRLIFSGELLDGQHRAVVKRRLTELLKLKDGQIEKLFCGQPVTLKRDVDRETAARYQTLFKKAGGQLRVKSESPAAEQAAPAAAVNGVSQSPEQVDARSAAADVEAPDIKVQTTWFPSPEAPRPEIEAPDFSVAAVGSDLADKAEAPVVSVAEVDFGLAEVGADLLIERKQVPVAEIGPLNFEVAEVGADIGTPRQLQEVAVPDISHLAVVHP
jgi:hypothetical protein